MQSAPSPADGSTWNDSTPSPPAISSSPRRISRSYLAPTRSSAHVSEATTGSSSIQPSTSGRKPKASRNANSFPSASPTTVAAPSSRSSAPEMASTSGRSSHEIAAAITSLSEVELRRGESSSRSSSAFVRLPLWPSATVRTVP